jgi:alpha-tubulin suppressor-like RCC1 family protein
MAIGGESTCAVFDGGLVCLGMVNAYSGIVGTTRWGVPGLSGGSGVISAATHDDHGCALLQTGTLRCFGRNDYGQLGDGTTMDHPFAVTVQGVGTGATAISVGFSHSCAIIDGGVKCWGSNSGGELGLGSTGLSVVTPTAVLAPDAGTAVAVRCGTFHTCAVFDKNGARSMRCWGFNSKGQLGSGDQANTSLPTAVVGLPAGALRIAPGYQHTCATVAGGAQCWGWNRLGQLGNGNALTGTNDFVLLPGPVSAPASLTPLAEPTALVSGSSHTCAILDGGAWCWGDNQNHQLANIPAGGAASRPVAADGLSSGVLELGAGTFHTCALVAVGAQRRMRCWGLNTSGQLGQPNTALSTDVPLDVPGL